MRKDAILQRQDGLAAKMEVVLGELQRGPRRYRHDSPQDPNSVRERALTAPTDPGHAAVVNDTSKQLTRGARLDSVDIPTRQEAVPVMKTNRVRQVSRTNYGKAHSLDRAVDACAEYEIDSRHLGPRLLRVRQLEERLEEARSRYENCRQQCRAKRIQFDEMRADCREKMEEGLKEEMLDYGSHVPVTLPLEFSKFSAKVLNVRERERKSAWFRRYDEAAAHHKDALRMEREELDVNSDRFARSFKIQRGELLRKQDMKRAGFDKNWQAKTEGAVRETARELADPRKAVEHWERDLAEARRLAGTELARIKNNERIAHIPVQSRQAASPRRF
jgi:hypothetical protein